MAYREIINYSIIKNKICKIHKINKFNIKINKLTIQELKIINLHNILNKSIQKINTKIDLRNKFPPIYDQGYLSSCTANALCGLIGFEHPGLFGSRLFLYYNERKLNNSIDSDQGAYISDGIITLQKNGVCLEKEWPYIKKFNQQPPLSCYQNALKYKALKVYNIQNNKLEMQKYLIDNNPFVVGIAIYSSFMNINVGKTGYVKMPDINTETFIGGHCVVCVGYNTKYWIMRNSWGTSWGANGYFYLPYDYLLNDNLATDMWCIIKI